MSSGNRVSLHTAQTIANQFYDLLADIPGHMTIAGSIRRRRLSIGDIEIVCLPDNPGDLLTRLDKLFHDRKIDKAFYGDSTRWGDKLRGCIYKNMQVEISIADNDNYGYQLWLHTGPADANKLVMTQMKIHRTPIRFSDGYAWHVLYDNAVGHINEYRKLAKLSVPDEWKLFHILGMPEMLPWDRSELGYRRYIGRNIRKLPEDEIKALYTETEQQIPKQLSLFD